MDRNSMDALVAEGHRAHDEQRFADAYRLFTKALTLDGDRCEALRGAARSAVELELWQSAERWARELLSTACDELSQRVALRALHSATEATGRHDEALDAIERLWRINPAPYNGVLYAFTLKRAGRPETSREILEDLAARPDASEETLVNLGAHYFEFGTLDEALPWFQLAVTRFPEFEGAWLAIGATQWCLSTRGGARHLLAQARASLLRAARLGARKDVVASYLSVVYLSMHRFSLAERWAWRACLHAPDDPDEIATLGRALIAQGKLMDAERELRRAVSRWPDHASLLLYFGDCLLRLGRVEEARAQYVAILTRAPWDELDHALAHGRLNDLLDR